MNIKTLFFSVSLAVLSCVNLNAYIDANGIPQPGIFNSYRGIHNLRNFIIGNWRREAHMLTAFEQNDLSAFEELFLPEDAGRHPHLIEDALHSGNIEMLRIMHKKGLNIHAVYKNFVAKDSMLQDAVCFHDNAALVEFLLEIGCNVNESGDHGSALHIAVYYNHAQAADKLIDRGADLNASNENGTALHMTAHQMNTVIAQKLIEHGADVMRENQDKKTVGTLARENLHWCEQSGVKSVAEVKERKERCEQARHFLSAFEAACAQMEKQRIQARMDKESADLAAQRAELLSMQDRLREKAAELQRQLDEKTALVEQELREKNKDAQALLKELE